MAFRVSERALALWAGRDLKVEPGDDGSYRFRFAYEGSSCRDGGKEFQSEIVAALTPEAEGRWRIADVQVEIDPTQPGWLATCIHESTGEPDPAEITARLPARGMLLDEFLSGDWPVNNAGCFCTSIHVTHKLLLALSTARWWLEHRTG